MTDIAISNSGRAYGLAALTTSLSAVFASSACCIIPLAAPPLALAIGGTALAWLVDAHNWLTGIAALMLVAAWVLVRRQPVRPGRATMAMLGASTILTAIALAWRWIEQPLVGLLGG